MHYETFSRHLREKYSTRLHVADQLVDQLKHKNQQRLSKTSVQELNNRIILKAQQEISLPLISYLNKFECDLPKPIENKNEFEPYFNECLLAAERVKNNRRSDRDRQICYENLILAEKLERIKNHSGQKDYQNHCRLLTSKVNCEQNSIKSINKILTAKQSLLSNQTTLNVNEESSSYTEITSCHSSSPIESESKTSSSENEDDQATAADVDASMEYSDIKSPRSCKQRNNRNFNCALSMSTKSKETYLSKNQHQRFFETGNNNIYQHLSNIDMTLVRDTMPRRRSPLARHFSICILPHFDSDAMNNRSKIVSHDRQYAFKKEILYH